MILPAAISDTLFLCSLLISFKCNHFTNPANVRPVSPQSPSPATCKMHHFFLSCRGKLLTPCSKNPQLNSSPCKAEGQTNFLHFNDVYSSTFQKHCRNLQQFFRVSFLQTETGNFWVFFWFLRVFLVISLKRNGEHACTSEEHRVLSRCTQKTPDSDLHTAPCGELECIISTLQIWQYLKL